MPTLEHNKLIRNNLLVESDSIISELTDEKEIQRWVEYRAQLRTFFDDKPEDYDYTRLVWPRTPRDVDALLEKAAAGDEAAQEIVERDNL